MAQFDTVFSYSIRAAKLGDKPLSAFFRVFSRFFAFFRAKLHRNR